MKKKLKHSQRDILQKFHFPHHFTSNMTSENSCVQKAAIHPKTRKAAVKTS